MRIHMFNIPTASFTGKNESLCGRPGCFELDESGSASLVWLTEDEGEVTCKQCLRRIESGQMAGSCPSGSVSSQVVSTQAMRNFLDTLHLDQYPTLRAMINGRMVKNRVITPARQLAMQQGRLAGGDSK